MHLKKWERILNQSKILEVRFYKKNAQIGFIRKILNNYIRYHKIEDFYHLGLKI